MAEEVKFGEKLTGKSKKKKMGFNLYPPQDGKSITVRFVGIQQKIYQKWNSATKTFSCYDSKKDDKCILRIVSYVIDREDDRIKAFVCPSSVFGQLGEYGSKHDFVISRRGQALNTKYDIRSLGETEVDQDLLDRVEITSNAYPIADIFLKGMKWELLDKDNEPIDNRFDILDL